MNTLAAVSLTGKRKSGDPPLNSQVSVMLTETFGEVDGLPRLTVGLVSDVEIDFAIDSLIKYLEKARVQAKKMLKEEKKQSRASAGEA